MNWKKFLEFNFAKVMITVLLVLLVSVVGIVFFSDTVWLRTGCAPNPSCPFCEICLSYGYNVVRYQALLLLTPLYLLSCLIYYVFHKYSKSKKTKR